MALAPFHVAFPVDDLAAARAFYGSVLGCPEGRSSDTWIDFDLFGHQIVAHLKPGPRASLQYNPVDLHDVPIPHFGVVLSMPDWEGFAERVKSKGVSFVIEPISASRARRASRPRCSFSIPRAMRLSSKRSKT